MRSVFLLILFLFSITYAQSLSIAAAANVQYALVELIKEFKKENPELTVKKAVYSSGKLTAQIVKGAPFDIFMSADMKYPMFLYKNGYAVSKPKVYAKGILILWSIKNIPLKEKGINILLEENINKIAIPNPKNAPYGQKAIDVLKYYNLYKKVKSKLVYGESVGQANQYIFKGLADIGFTSKSTVFAPVTKNKGVWLEIDKKAYTPIEQGVVLLKYGQNNIYAKKFYKFLFSKKAREIFRKYGYGVDEQN